MRDLDDTRQPLDEVEALILLGESYRDVENLKEAKNCCLKILGILEGKDLWNSIEVTSSAAFFDLCSELKDEKLKGNFY